MAFRLKYFNFFLTRFIIFLYGSYVRSVTGDIDLKTIYLDQINQNLEKKKFKSERRKIWQERFQWFIFPALLFLLYRSQFSSKKTGNESLKMASIYPSDFVRILAVAKAKP